MTSSARTPTTWRATACRTRDTSNRDGFRSSSRAFFDMPLGRSEDLVMDEYRERIQQLDGDEDAAEALWAEFRARLDKALERRDMPVDMGMDLGG